MAANHRLKVKRSNINNKRTDRVSRRDKQKFGQLWRQGLTEVEIAEKLKRDPRTVRKHLGLSVKMELKRLLSPCLANPQLNLPNITGRYPLQLKDQDFRLNPILWFHLCTPDFSEECEGFWGDYTQLERKMEKIRFWQHYVKLKSGVYKLQSDYERACEKLPQSERNVWDRIQSEGLSTPLPYRVPSHPEPECDEYESGYDHKFCNSLLQVFRTLIPDLDDRFIALEQLLQQLNDDLDDKHSERNINYSIILS